jgi:excisionase family DNA binding protein
MDERLLTSEEVQEKLQISRHTLYRLIEARELTAIKLGPKLLRFKESEVKNFIEKSQTQPEEAKSAQEIKTQ